VLVLAALVVTLRRAQPPTGKVRRAGKPRQRDLVVPRRPLPRRGGRPRQDQERQHRSGPRREPRAGPGRDGRLHLRRAHTVNTLAGNDSVSVNGVAGVLQVLVDRAPVLDRRRGGGPATKTGPPSPIGP